MYLTIGFVAGFLASRYQAQLVTAYEHAKDLALKAYAYAKSLKG